ALEESTGLTASQCGTTIVTIAGNARHRQARGECGVDLAFDLPRAGRAVSGPQDGADLSLRAVLRIHAVPARHGPGPLDAAVVLAHVGLGNGLCSVCGGVHDRGDYHRIEDRRGRDAARTEDARSVERRADVVAESDSGDVGAAAIEAELCLDRNPRNG